MQPTAYFVDDDAAVRDALLSQKGVPSQVCPSAETLLETCRLEWFGCLLTHLRMTDLERHRERSGWLASRERYVAQLFVEGLLNREIAARPGINPCTVAICKARMMEKLDCGSLGEMLRTMAGFPAVLNPAQH